MVAHDPDDLVPVVGGELVEAAQRARLERRGQRGGPLRQHCDRHGPCLVFLCSLVFRAWAWHGGISKITAPPHYAQPNLWQLPRVRHTRFVGRHLRRAQVLHQTPVSSRPASRPPADPLFRWQDRARRRLQRGLGHLRNRSVLRSQPSHRSPAPSTRMGRTPRRRRRH